MTPAESLLEVMRLGALATGGVWEADGYGDVVVNGETLAWLHALNCDNDAAYIAAACNYLRTHGARIAELEARLAFLLEHRFTVKQMADTGTWMVLDCTEYPFDGSEHDTQLEALDAAIAAIDAALATSKGADAGEGG